MTGIFTLTFDGTTFQSAYSGIERIYSTFLDGEFAGSTAGFPYQGFGNIPTFAYEIELFLEEADRSTLIRLLMAHNERLRRPDNLGPAVLVNWSVSDYPLFSQFTPNSSLTMLDNPPEYYPAHIGACKIISDRPIGGKPLTYRILLRLSESSPALADIPGVDYDITYNNSLAGIQAVEVNDVTNPIATTIQSALGGVVLGQSFALQNINPQHITFPYFLAAIETTTAEVIVDDGYGPNLSITTTAGIWLWFFGIAADSATIILEDSGGGTILQGVTLSITNIAATPDLATITGGSCPSIVLA